MEELKQIMKMLEDISKRVTVIEDSMPKQSENKDTHKEIVIKVESFREFYLRHGPPKKETDKTLVIFHFLESKKDLDNITTKEIAQGFKEVREVIPKNISDKMQMLHKNGFVSPQDSAGRTKNWEITKSGLNHLEELKNGR